MSAEDFAIVRAVVATTYLGHPDDEALAALARIEARLAEVGRERDEFAEAMHKASLAVVRRRAATEEKRA